LSKFAVMEIVKKRKKAHVKKTKAPLVVTVKTASGNTVSMKQITPSEIKTLRNPAYKYLA
jgi:hypothetical protein